MDYTGIFNHNFNERHLREMKANVFYDLNNYKISNFYMNFITLEEPSSQH